MLTLEEIQSVGELPDQSLDTEFRKRLGSKGRQIILQSSLVAVLLDDTELAQVILEVVQVANYERMVQLAENQRLLLGHLSIKNSFNSLYSNLLSFLGVAFLLLNSAEIHTAKCSRPKASNYLEMIFLWVVLKPQPSQPNAGVSHDFFPCLFGSEVCGIQAELL